MFSDPESKFLSIFFTFYGLLLLKKEIPSEVSPLGNPAMPMKMPFGPKWFQNFTWPMPNLIMAGIPDLQLRCAVSRGDYLTTDAQSRAVVAVPGTDRLVGAAMSKDVLNDIIAAVVDLG